MPIQSAAKKAATPAPPLPKQARSYPSLQQWLARPDNVIRLKQILSDPVFVAACHYVENSVNVEPQDLIGPHAALAEVVVRKAAMATGVRMFTTAITALPGCIKADTPNTPDEPWGHIHASPTR